MPLTQPQTPAPLGFFVPGETVAPGPSLVTALRRVRRPLYLQVQERDVRVMTGSAGRLGEAADRQPFTGIVPALPLAQLGDKSFCQDQRIRYPYVAGSMAKGISSVALVKALADAGMLAFFGAAGLGLDEVETAIDQLRDQVGEQNFGFNLIHSPNESNLENALVDLYLRRGIRLVEASAFLDLTLALVRYRTHGLHRDAHGQVIAPNHVIGKISREEVAAKFFAPPPERFLRELVAAGDLTEEQAKMAGEIPMARDVTVESDSGGHTDNRPALALFPTIQTLRDAYQQQHDYAAPLRVGLGGGIATPASAAAAFALGAAYLVTGTINQACVESGSCDVVRQMLAETRQADVVMAPSGDMFEMGVNVQVMKRGTMFSMRAAKLYELYRAYGGIEDLPAAERDKLEKTIFRKSLDQVWEETRGYFQQRDPRQVTRAEGDPKYKMALVFRWYLGQSPVWANQGIADRKLDYQIWCGPAMGAFNEWTRGSFLEAPAQRRVATVALNILFGAAVLMRATQLRMQGVSLNDEDSLTTPLETEQIKEFLT
ncbi:MAG: PfaD family polyunsaturated fatty acid/polyketide biosynthesis protein [Desulfuromonadales bacterium]